MTDYEDFLATKLTRAPATGFEPGPMPDALFPFQQDIARWACRRGRAAIFADTGLGKTRMQLAWASEVVRHTGGRVLILAPLAVGRQTSAEAETVGIAAPYRRDDGQDTGPGITITNYEMLPRFLGSTWDGVVLDESSILKSFDGKTKTAIIEAFRETPYKLACTATPSPNDTTELGNHAEFLGAMTRAEMLAMYFFHDGGETSKWTIKGHAQGEFWKWVASWGCVVRKPSDLGYDNASYDLPPIEYFHHVVPASQEHAKAAGVLFVEPVSGLNEQRKARRATLSDRVKIAVDLANGNDEQWLVWAELNDEADALASAIRGAEQVAGKDSDFDKEMRMLRFARGELRVLVSKPKICGFGMNFQAARNMAFVGVSHSFESFYQCIRREWRYGQKRAVNVHVITSELEGKVLANLQRKEQEAASMASELGEHMGDAVREEVGRVEAVKPDEEYVPNLARGTGWDLFNADCVEGVRGLGDACIGYTIFSPPFASLYTYSNSMRDMGNVRTHTEFYDHFKFLVPELLRVTKPGRLLSFHCMNLPTSKTRDGVIGLTDFRGLLISMFQEAGWIFHSEVCIWKDPVTAMQRTHALGLLHRQLKKDSCMSRQGIPDYLVTMRKPGENATRVEHTNESFPVEMWQQYASPVWMDINPNETLQRERAREDKDERHICPLQLEIIRRGIELWTNPGDLVLSPFAGIGSEGYVALQEGRRFLGWELKTSYWELARKNLASVEMGVKKQIGLFDTVPAVAQ
jgi:superfamily II DNA or RNA helicase